MTLRIMLMGLVASLGFELPSGADVSGWAKAGAAWARRRCSTRRGRGSSPSSPSIGRPTATRPTGRPTSRPPPK